MAIAVALALFIRILLGLGLRGPRDGRYSVVENEPTAKKGPTRADKALVDHWLRENLDDPDYEVVKWYGPVHINNPLTMVENEFLNGSRTGLAKEQLDDLREINDRWQLEHPAGRHVIGLKFRCRQRLVGKILTQADFEIKNGKAVPWNEHYAFREWFQEDE